VGLGGKKAVKMALIRWPAVLMQPPDNVARLAAFLRSDDVGFDSESEVGSLLRLAPWLVAGASEGEFRDGDGGKYRAVVRCLSEVGGLRGRLRRSPDATILGRKGGAANPPPSSMSMVVRAFPQVFDLDVATELAPRIRFLRDEAGIPTEDVHSVIQSFPLILGLDVSTRMRPVVEYVTRQTRTKRNPHVFCWSQLMPCSLKHILSLFYLSF
jgi:hypothetical protein